MAVQARRLGADEAAAQAEGGDAPRRETPGPPTHANKLAPAELSPEELALLPNIEDLTPDADVTVFLQKGVPARLRNAALRRMWALDPAIRDYVSEAREYAYDWSVPGGVPGTGPLLESDDVAAIVRQAMGGPDASGSGPEPDRESLPQIAAASDTQDPAADHNVASLPACTGTTVAGSVDHDCPAEPPNGVA
jgi:hypothetical protein